MTDLFHIYGCSRCGATVALEIETSWTEECADGDEVWKKFICCESPSWWKLRGDGEGFNCDGPFWIFQLRINELEDYKVERFEAIIEAIGDAA